MISKKDRERQGRAARNWMLWKDGNVLTTRQWLEIAKIISKISDVTILNKTSREAARAMGIIPHDKRDDEMLSRCMWLLREKDSLNIDHDELTNPNIIFQRNQRGQTPGTVGMVPQTVDEIVKFLEGLPGDIINEVLKRVEHPHTVSAVKHLLSSKSLGDLVEELVDVHERIGNLVVNVAMEESDHA